MKTLKPLTYLAFIGFMGMAMPVSCSSEKDQDQQNQATTASSDFDPNKPTQIPQKDEARVSATSVVEKIICPEAATLRKKGLFWGAPNGWRSFSQSFVNNIEAFFEAQWQGVNVGKMMCVYVGKEKRSFPVVLQNDLLTKMPTGFKWGNYKAGVVRCSSPNINDCPFFHTKRDIDVEKAYDELDFKKGEADELN